MKAEQLFRSSGHRKLRRILVLLGWSDPCPGTPTGRHANDFDDDVSLEVFGRRDWSDKLAVGDEQAKAELGNNSIGGGGGIKFTF